MAIYDNLGFKFHPFVNTNADDEEFLDQYFVPPPFFEGVIGDSSNATPCVVFAPRGGGKTAQKRMVENWSNSNRVLAVSYDRFEFSGKQNLNDVDLNYHIRNIIIRVLVSYLSYLSEYPDLLRNLDKTLKKYLSLSAHTYLGSMTGVKLQNLLLELRSIPDKIKDFWSNNVGFMESVVNVLLKKYGLEKIDLPDVKIEEKKLNASYRHQLEVFYNLVNLIGFKSIYILIDKVDESEKTGNDAFKTYQLIKPLMTDLEFLSSKGYGIKFFIWDKVEEYFVNDARPDRVVKYNLNWNIISLESVLSKRLYAFSGNKIKHFANLVETDLGYPIDTVLCLLSNKSPRNLIRLCEKIFSEQSEIDSSSKSISSQAIERGIQSYCEMISREYYGDEVLRDMYKVGRELFSINFLSNNIFKTSHINTSRNKVSKWQKIGIVAQVGTVTIPGKKPSNFYSVIDPAMIRLLHKSSTIKEFLDNCWITCDHCSFENLFDISYFPEGNEPICLSCSKPLF